MSHSHTHPADTTLVLALDHELSVEERVALDRHLTACAACRSRFGAFRKVEQEAARVYREDAFDDVAATRALRRRLQERMMQLENEWDRSSLFRCRRAAASVPPLARGGLIAAFFVLVMQFVHVHVTVGPLASRPPSLPISRFTPGATSNASARDLCSESLPARRVVPTAVRQDVLRKYRMEDVAPSEYELDYLITPELGGVADSRNLWPERYDAVVWNARVKDDLERLLPRLVCDGTVDLARAQREIADNWINAYRKYFNTEQPIPNQAGLVDDDDEIQFEATPNVVTTGSARMSFGHPPVLVSARLTTTEALFTVQARKGSW